MVSVSVDFEKVNIAPEQLAAAATVRYRALRTRSDSGRVGLVLPVPLQVLLLRGLELRHVLADLSASWEGTARGGSSAASRQWVVTKFKLSSSFFHEH